MNRYNNSLHPTAQRSMGGPGPQESLATAMGSLNLDSVEVGSLEPKKYYVVTKGRRNGIYTSW